jgi:hypothetical protein
MLVAILHSKLAVGPIDDDAMGHIALIFYSTVAAVARRFFSYLTFFTHNCWSDKSLMMMVASCKRVS